MTLQQATLHSWRSTGGRSQQQHHNDTNNTTPQSITNTYTNTNNNDLQTSNENNQHNTTNDNNHNIGIHAVNTINKHYNTINMMRIPNNNHEISDRHQINDNQSLETDSIQTSDVIPPIASIRNRHLSYLR